jgi:hypothetical protein
MTAGHTTILDTLAQLLADRGPEPREYAARLAALDPAELVESALTAGGDVLELFTTDSYRHSNGFDKISFPATAGSQVRLQLHIWPAAAGRDSAGEPPDVHDHRWSFASRVLVGSISNEAYAATPAPGGRYLHYRHTEAGARSHRLDYAGRAELVLTGVDTCRRGSTYVMPPQTLHLVRPAGGDIAATAVLELAPARQVTQVYVSAGRPGRDAFVRLPRFSVSEVRARLRELHRLLTA